MVELRPADDIVAGDHGLEVALEHPLYVRRIRPGPAQVRCRLEGAAAGAVGEILGVQHDAGQQRLGLRLQQVARLDEVLEQLRHQLRR